MKYYILLVIVISKISLHNNISTDQIISVINSERKYVVTRNKIIKMFAASIKTPPITVKSILFWSANIRAKRISTVKSRAVSVSCGKQFAVQTATMIDLAIVKINKNLEFIELMRRKFLKYARAIKTQIVTTIIAHIKRSLVSALNFLVDSWKVGNVTISVVINS